MHRYITQRLLLSVPVLAGILFVTFALARLLPGDPCRAVLGERATDAICNDFIRRYGLDQPIPVQFGLYLQQLASGDLGTSIKDPALSLPPSGRLSSGISVQPLAEVWGLQGTAGPVRGFLDFVSGIYFIS